MQIIRESIQTLNNSVHFPIIKCPPRLGVAQLLAGSSNHHLFTARVFLGENSAYCHLWCIQFDGKFLLKIRINGRASFEQSFLQSIDSGVALWCPNKIDAFLQEVNKRLGKFGKSGNVKYVVIIETENDLMPVISFGFGQSWIFERILSVSRVKPRAWINVLEKTHFARFTFSPAQKRASKTFPNISKYISSISVAINTSSR